MGGVDAVTSPGAQARFDEIAQTLMATRGVQQAPAFGMPGLRSGGKVFAGLFGDAMVFKLGAGSDAHDAALALSGARVWDPSGRDRPFKDWVEVPSAHADQWPSLAEQAYGKLGAK
jgi:hypothetical protein